MASNALRTALVTGSSGLIGSEVVAYFCGLGWTVHGVNDNMCAVALSSWKMQCGYSDHNCEGGHIYYYPGWEITNFPVDVVCEIRDAMARRHAE